MFFAINTMISWKKIDEFKKTFKLDVGKEFLYLNIELIIQKFYLGLRGEPMIKANYLDDEGIIRSIEFDLDDLEKILMALEE